MLKNRLWQRCFPVNFAKFSRTHFYIDFFCSLLFYLELMVITVLLQLRISKYKDYKLVLLNKKNKKKLCKNIHRVYKVPLFVFFKVNVIKTLQTLYLVLLFIITSYLHIIQSVKTLFSNILSWKPLYVFV